MVYCSVHTRIKLLHMHRHIHTYLSCSQLHYYYLSHPQTYALFHLDLHALLICHHYPSLCHYRTSNHCQARKASWAAPLELWQDNSLRPRSARSMLRMPTLMRSSGVLMMMSSGLRPSCGGDAPGPLACFFVQCSTPLTLHTTHSLVCLIAYIIFDRRG